MLRESGAALRQRDTRIAQLEASLKASLEASLDATAQQIAACSSASRLLPVTFERVVATGEVPALALPEGSTLL
jgi:hypothetical protein